MDVLKKLRSLGKGESRDAEQKRRKEFYEFSEISNHGFLNKPTALCYDTTLGLLAVGNQFGCIRVYGKPGVQFSGEVPSRSYISKILFIPNEGRLIVLCKDNTVSLWELNVKNEATVLEQVKSVVLSTVDSQTLAVSCCCLTDNSEELLLGTEVGKIHVFNVKDFLLTDRVFERNALAKIEPEENKGNTGAVECILNKPGDTDKFLIGLSSGLVSLWNHTEGKAETVFSTGSNLEGITFRSTGEEFIVGHSDGSYSVWCINDSSKSKEDPTTTYGPYPCKAITKIESSDATGGELLLFCGGMARSSHGDRHTLSVIQGDKHVVFDLSSKIVDFITINSPESRKVSSLIILAEEELVAIDLETEGWPQLSLPYLSSIHSSPVTSVHLVHKVPDQTWNKIIAAGEANNPLISNKSWPINGGTVSEGSHDRNLLLSGHEDGTVNFWDASPAPGNFRLLCTIRTSELFDLCEGGVENNGQEQAEGEWPPFRKVGRVSQCLDDPRLFIQKMDFCVSSEMLFLGGAAGQVMALSFQRFGFPSTSVNVEIVSKDSRRFQWTGQESLKLREGFENHRYGSEESGLKPVCVAQLYPPASCSAISLQSDWKIFAVGTVHGYALIDYARSTVVYTKCTLAPAGSAPRASVTRSRSLQKTFRESFRKLRIRPPVSRSFDVAQHASVEERDEVKVEGEGPVTTTEMKTLPEEPATVTEGQTNTVTEGQTTNVTEGQTNSVTEGQTTESTEPEKKTDDQTNTEEKINTEPVKTDVTADSVTAAETSEQTPAAEPQQPQTTEVSETVEEKTSAPTEGEKSNEEKIVSETTEQKTEEPETIEMLEVAFNIHSLYLTNSYLLQGQPMTPTLWVGNGLGQITSYRLTIPSNDKRMEEEVQCVLAKEIHLQHGAPVICLRIIDKDNQLISEGTAEPSAAEHEGTAAAPSSPTKTTAAAAAGHRLVVCTQEQIKVFSLPSLKPQHKVKLATKPGQAKIINFSCGTQFIGKTESSDGQRQKLMTVLGLTDDGLVHVYSLPHLRKQFEATVASPEDTLAINSCVFSTFGYGLYLKSESEVSSFSLSAYRQGHVTCSVTLPEGARPIPPPPQETPTPAAEESETTAAAAGEKVGNDVTAAGLDESATSGAGDVTTDSVHVHLVEEGTAEKNTVVESSVDGTTNTTTTQSNGNTAAEESCEGKGKDVEEGKVESNSEDVVKVIDTEVKKVDEQIEHISTDIDHLKLEAQKEFAKAEEALTSETSEVKVAEESK